MNIFPPYQLSYFHFYFQGARLIDNYVHILGQVWYCKKELRCRNIWGKDRISKRGFHIGGVK